MATIYISSTYNDLEKHRKAVYHTLHQLGHTVIAMEDYVARDQRPLDKCLNDVAKSDIYIGIFAWRYGYIPEKDNPQKKSITELEYRKASEIGIRRLIFLLKEDTPWPPLFMDSMVPNTDGLGINQLRGELEKEFLVNFFRTPSDLALAASLSVTLESATEQPSKLKLADNLAELEQPIEVGGSQVSEIERKIIDAINDSGKRPIIELNLGIGKSWWSTRLYLLAALAADFTEIQQIVFADADGVFIGMASPLITSRAILAANQYLNVHYKAKIGSRGSNLAGGVVLSARDFLESFKPDEEANLKEWVTKEYLKACLGKNFIDSHVPIQSTNYRKTHLFLYQIIGRTTEFVSIITPDGKLVGVVNRTKLAVSIAETELRRLLEQQD